MNDGRLLVLLGLLGLTGAAAARGSRGAVRAARPAPELVPELGRGWVKPVPVPGRYGSTTKVLPDNPIWSLPADNQDVRFDMTQRGPWGIVTSVRGLAVDREGRIWGIRSMSGVKESGYQLEGKVSLGGKSYTAFTSSIHLRRSPDSPDVEVATLYVRHGRSPDEKGSAGVVRRGPVPAPVETGAGGWPLVPSQRFPGEKTLACPVCRATNVTITGTNPGYGTGPGGRWRMGDPGGRDVNVCGACGHRSDRPLPGSKGVVRSARPALHPLDCTYAVAYEVIDADDGEVSEAGFIVNSMDIESPDFTGPQVTAWRAEQGVDMPLDPANDEEIDDALELWRDADEIDLAQVPRPLRCAITFARITRDAGATEFSGSDWWSTEPSQDMYTGNSREESYHPSDDLCPYVPLIDAIVHARTSKARQILREVLRG